MFINRILRSAYQYIRKIRKHPIQKIQTSSIGFNIVNLGSDYGGWSFVDDGNLNNCTIISAGLGEDASFDVEFASKYDAKIIMVDPTPRAVAHFKALIDNLGRKKTQNYVEGGRQPIEAYELSSVSQKNFNLVDKALWDENTKLKFFLPPNPDHVSHSIINFQNNYNEDGKYIEVEATTMSSLILNLPQLDIKTVPLIKLDIEGAEVEVLIDCMKNKIFPSQILVEFDELNAPSRRGFSRITNIHNLMLENGYSLIHRNGSANFLYLQNKTG